MTRGVIFTYRNSVFATLVSLAGTISIFLGFYVWVDDAWYSGLTVIAIGIGLMIEAYRIAQRVNFKKWIKRLSADGVIDALPSSEALCIKLYQSNPCKRTLRFISKRNPEAADYISKFIVSQK